MKDPTAKPTSHERHIPPTPLLTSRAVPAMTTVEEGVCGRDIFGGLALAAFAHKATTSGCAHDDGNMTTFVLVDLLAVATPTKWTLSVRLPMVTPQAVLSSSVPRLGREEDEGDLPVALHDFEKSPALAQCSPGREHELFLLQPSVATSYSKMPLTMARLGR